MCERKSTEGVLGVRSPPEVPTCLRHELEGKDAELVDIWSDFPKLSDPKLQHLWTPKQRIFSAGQIAQEFWYIEESRTLVARITFLERAQGNPGLAHGGAIATVFDNAFGVLVWRHVVLPFGHGCPTLQLNVAYKQFVRLLHEVKLVAVIDRIDGRKVHVRGQIECPTTSKVLASAEAVFYCMAEPAKMLRYEQGRELFGANSRYSSDELLALFSRKSKL